MSEIAVASILTELEAQKTQIRLGTDPDTVAVYAEAFRRRGTAFPPVRLVSNGKGRFFIADGWHRVLAAREAKIAKINAVTLPPMDGLSPLQSAVRYALRSNTDHGLRLGPGDLRQKVRRALAECPEIEALSDRKAADELRVSHQLVSKARAELVFEGVLPHRETGLRGDEYLPREYAGRQEFRTTFERDPEQYLEVRAYLSKLSAQDPSAWSWDADERRVTHSGLVDGAVLVFGIEGNPVAKGLPKVYERHDDEPLPKPSTDQRELMERRNARRTFEAARKAIEDTGRKDLIAAARTLAKYRDVPNLFCHLRTLVEYGDSAALPNDDF